MTSTVPASVQFPGAVPEMFNMAELLLATPGAAGCSDQPSLYYRDEVVTYGQLIQMVNRVGNGLRQLGLRREQRVLIALPDSPAFIATFLGAMKIGAVPVPVTTLTRCADYQYFLRDSRARILVVGAELLPVFESFLGEVPTLKATLVVGNRRGSWLDWEKMVNSASSQLDYEPTRGEEMSYWLYSSGTTGRPKAVIHLHGDMVHCTRPFLDEVACLSPSDRIFSVAKMGFSYGLVSSLYLPLLTGASVVLLADRPEPATVLETLRRYRPTVFFSVPTAYLRLLQFIEREKPGVDFRSLRLCVSAGEPLPAWLFEQWRARFGLEILDGLGSTEAGYIYLCSRPGQARPASCGHLLPGFDGKLVDEQGQPVAEGEVGELWLKGDSLAAGYWHDDSETRKTFLGAWFRTGDMFVREADGYYRYVGRRDDLFKVSGHWVSPLEVEDVLLSHSSVAECAVVGGTDAYGLLKPCAYVRLKDGLAPANLRQELQDYVRARLESFKVPRQIEYVPSLPRTTTGKIQRVRLREVRESV